MEREYISAFVVELQRIVDGGGFETISAIVEQANRDSIVHYLSYKYRFENVDIDDKCLNAINMILNNEEIYEDDADDKGIENGLLYLVSTLTEYMDAIALS